MAFFRKTPEIFRPRHRLERREGCPREGSGRILHAQCPRMASLPPDAITDGTIKDAATVAEAIRTAVSRPA